MNGFDVFPFFDLCEAQKRVAVHYSKRIDKIDLGSKSGFVKEIDEFQGYGEFCGVLDKAFFLYRDKKIGEGEVRAVIAQWEKLWMKLLGVDKNDRR